jgi:hypothetical protein
MNYCEACGLEFSRKLTKASHSCPVVTKPQFSDCFSCAVTQINPSGVKDSYPHWWSAFKWLPSLNSMGLPLVAGNFSEEPPDTYKARASPGALSLIQRSFEASKRGDASGAERSGASNRRDRPRSQRRVRR